MVTRLRPVSKSEFLVTIANLQGYWTQFSGIDDSHETSEYSDGISNRKRTVRGQAKAADVTLSKPFDPELDAAIVDFYKNWCEQDDELSISVQPIKRCGGIEQRGNRKLTMQGCKLLGLKGFEVDSDSGDVSMLELSISVDDWSFG